MEFTALAEAGFRTIVIPIVMESDIWAISHPLANEVWYAWIICVPLYLFVMVLADYIFFGMAKWKQLSGFVLRNVFSEHAEMPLIKQAYQKILVIIWVASIFLLVQCYAGNLTAMLTAPGLPSPIKNATEFLKQSEIPLVMYPFFHEAYFKWYSPDTIEGKLGRIASVSEAPLTSIEHLKYGCYSTKQYNNGRIAAICANGEFWALISNDYSRTGQCNFYRTKDQFLRNPQTVGAFQVWLLHEI